MKSKLLKLIAESAPTALSSKVKSDNDLIQFVSTYHGDTISEKIYNAAYEPIIACDNGNNKKFISFTKGYGYCGKAGTCKCAAAFMSSRMKELKPMACQKNIDLLARRDAISKFTTSQDIKDYITEHSNGYASAIEASNPDMYNQIISFVDNCSIPAKFWHFINNVKEIPRCKCGKQIRFINVLEGYANDCKTCYNKQRAENSVVAVQLKSQSEHAPICKATGCNNPVLKKKSGVWGQYCSTKCKGKFNSIVGQEKAKATFKEKYGVEHALQSPTILAKMFATNIANHGVPIVSQNKAIFEKSQATKMIKYGYTSQWQDPAKRIEHVDQVAIKFGYSAGQFTNVMQIPEVFQKAQENQYTNKEYTLPSGEVIIIQGYENFVLDSILKSYDETSLLFKTFYQYGEDKNVQIYFPDFEIYDVVVEVKSQYTLTKDFDKNISKFSGIVAAGKELVVAVSDPTGSAISFLPFNTSTEALFNTIRLQDVRCDRLHSVGKYTYDLVIHDANLLIKYVDPRFLTEDIVGRTHLIELQQNASAAGYTTLFFDVHSLKERFSQISNFIGYKLNRNTAKIFARKCIVRLASAEEARSLYNKKHLQGFTTASYHIGLYYANELVSCMSFSKFRPGIGKNRGDNAYELSRFASNTNVIGAASKLMNYFRRMYNPSLIYSFSDNMYSTGNLYQVLGFVQENDQEKPSYRYANFFSTELIHRFNFSKSKLKEFPNYEEFKSEAQIMKEAGYARIYDAGKKTWILK